MISLSLHPQFFSNACPKEVVCRHPGIGFICGFCMQCGKKIDDESGVTFRYMHKNLSLANEEIARLRDGISEKLPQQIKLCLVLDLDHTLLNSCHLSHLAAEEEHVKGRRHDLPVIIVCTQEQPVQTRLHPDDGEMEALCAFLPERSK